MNEIKEQLIKACQQKLDYYDVVDEGIEAIDYGMIIDVLCQQIFKMIRNKLWGD